MYKKIIAMILACTMLVSTSPAVAADQVSASPTVEEILNDYHRKSLDAHIMADDFGASAYSRNGTSSNLSPEQETVNTLIASGYEAYNITADNYEILESELKTDLSSMGLSSEGSYIIVIGEETLPQSTPSDKQSTYRNSSLPEQDEAPDGGGSTFFEYTYNGKTYFLRSVTVTSNGNDGLSQFATYAESKHNWLADHFRTLTDTMIVGLVDGFFAAGQSKIPVGTLLSIALDFPEEHVCERLELDSLCVDMLTNWTSVYLQVWDSQNQKWVTSQFSEYATSMIYCDGYVYDPVKNYFIEVGYNPQQLTSYSYYYHDLAQRCLFAMKAYDHYTITPDTVGYISFYWGAGDGEVLADGTTDALIAKMTRSTTMILPE